MALDFFGLGRHLVIDAVVSTVYRNTILSKTSTIPGYVAKLAEDKKFKADEKSSEPAVSSKHMEATMSVPGRARGYNPRQVGRASQNPGRPWIRVLVGPGAGPGYEAQETVREEQGKRQNKETVPYEYS